MQIVEEIYVLLFMLRWLHTNPSKIGLDRKSYNPRQQQADFWHEIFFILSFPNVPTYPIISQNWIFVTSHFFTLNEKEKYKDKTKLYRWILLSVETLHLFIWQVKVASSAVITVQFRVCIFRKPMRAFAFKHKAKFIQLLGVIWLRC